MRESVIIYQEIKAEGEITGRHQEASSLVIRLLIRKLGNLDSELETRIQGLSVNQLEALGEALLDFTLLDDLLAWLDSHL